MQWNGPNQRCAVHPLQGHWPSEGALSEVAEAAPAMQFRRGVPADARLIYDSWLRSQWQLDARHKMTRAVFFPMQRSRIERLLQRSSVVVAYHRAEASEALGYIVLEANHALSTAAVHWLYVKQPYRRLGVARQLICAVQALTGATFLQHTHKSDARAKKLAQRFGSTFNPYAAE